MKRKRPGPAREPVKLVRRLFCNEVQRRNLPPHPKEMGLIDMKNTALSIATAFLPALSGFCAQPDDWYRGLKKPALNPPNWVFGPVWSALYASMGLAHAVYSQAETSNDKRLGHALFGTQLTLNALWSPLFFKAHSPRLALLDSLAMWWVILATIIAFHRVAPRAARLMVPYLAWVTFATYLNAEIVRLNTKKRP